ncbi:TonB-dependent receptor [Sulfurimonas lithotrophica]|uniref:TonB-dependent receptor n=1 Tax=Sulfurimonas lithotrophica TaxID=2590022 RepID=A0A5P8P2N2_9BACT|nr:TonB-dependent receptor [Sulfurimonas lithotrophica]QFR49988.1 TonB-dependent receptor [Sulfurimonas lithotrophica]
MSFKIFLLLALSIILNAQVIDKIEVTTGTRTNKVLSEAPIRTEVVTKKDIANLHAKNVSEAIKNIPGLLIKETHGKQGQSVSIQGYDSDRVLILIDGEPMTNPSGQTVDLTQLNVNDVESIEIIKGAASALYGSQAMGGVINIITSKPKNGNHNSASLELGSYLSKSPDDMPVAQAKLSSTYKDDNIAASIYADYKHDSGVKLKDEFTYALPEADRLNLNAELRFLAQNEFYVKPRIYLERTLKPFSSFVPGTGEVKKEKDEVAQKYRLGLGGSGKLKNSDSWKIMAFGERYYDTTETNTLSTSYIENIREAVIDLAHLDSQYDTTFLDSHLITMGITLKYQALEQEEIKNSQTNSIKINELTGNASSHTYEVYIQDDWFITNNFEVLPGFRYQNDSDFGSYLSPKISFLYSFIDNDYNNLNIRASYGNGYRAPSIKERYFNFDHSQYGYMVIGNPNLEPESSHSYQLSFEWIRKKNFNANINFYYNDIKDLIDTKKNIQKSILNGLEIHEYINIDSALTSGVEISGAFYFMNHYSINGGYTYLYSEDKNTKKHLTSRPEHQVKTILSYNKSTTNILLSFIYESDEFVDSENKIKSPSSTQIDIKMTTYVTKLLSIYGGINNLLDNHQNVDDEHDLRTKRPRYIYAGVTYNF